MVQESGLLYWFVQPDGKMTEMLLQNLKNPKIDENDSLGLKTSSAEKSGTENTGAEKSNTTPYLTYSNFATQEYSTSGGSMLSSQLQSRSENTADELKLQQLQYQQVFQKHNNHLIPRIDQQEENRFAHKEPTDDDFIVDDGETSQMDLV
ncbi:hypothetical protein G6F56_009306 [Rhizopus delemar]|nr:hypothetical protein G6F56_009306 [Rhizopus delemar]